MPMVSATRRVEYAPMSVSRASASRRFRREVADVLCVEEAGGDVAPRIHSRFAIVLVRSPAVVRLESSRSIIADRNWIVLVPAWQLYALRTHSAAVTGVAHAPVVLQVAASRVDALGLADGPALVSDAEMGAQLASLVGQIQWSVRSVECQSTIASVLERLVPSRTLVASARSGNAAEPLVAVRDYLHAHMTDQISTETLSRLSGLTESHLIRAFHREFGLPPHSYHVRLRLAAACEQLAGGLPVSTVAYECGFADQSHLSRQFKETYGMTPAAWANAVADRHVKAA